MERLREWRATPPFGDDLVIGSGDVCLSPLKAIYAQNNIENRDDEEKKIIWRNSVEIWESREKENRKDIVENEETEMQTPC